MQRKSKKEQQLVSKLGEIGSTQQLKQIFKNVLSVNQSLQGDVQMLRKKIKECEERRLKKSAPEEPLLKAIQLQKQEINSQYKIMQTLKSQRDAQSTLATDELKEQILRLTNDLVEKQQQLSEIKSTISDLSHQNAHLQLTIAEREAILTKNDPKVHQISLQNAEIRKQITNLSRNGNQHEYESAKIVNSLYLFKAKLSSHQEIFQESNRKVKMTTMKNSSTLQLKSTTEKSVDPVQLEKEVDSLKKQCQRVSQQQLKEEINLKGRIHELSDENKEILKKLNALEQCKLKLSFEQNKFKKRWREIYERKQSEVVPFVPKTYKNAEAQVNEFEEVDKNVSKPLRRDFAGVLGSRYTFDDRLALRETKVAKIVGFTVYEFEMPNGKVLLSAVQAHYNPPFETQLDLPTTFLEKCKRTHHMLNEDDFLKQIKVKCNTAENRVMKVQFRSNRNLKFEYGDKRAIGEAQHSESVYAFDIQDEEYPVCLFGSYGFSRQSWQLETLGAEIRSIPGDS